jgi:hypothetical protein
LTFAHKLSSTYGYNDSYALRLLCQLEITSLKNPDSLNNLIDYSDGMNQVDAEIQKIPKFSTFTAIKPKVVPPPIPVLYRANSFETVDPSIKLKESERCALCCDFA